MNDKSSKFPKWKKIDFALDIAEKFIGGGDPIEIQKNQNIYAAINQYGMYDGAIPKVKDYWQKCAIDASELRNRINEDQSDEMEKEV